LINVHALKAKSESIDMAAKSESYFTQMMGRGDQRVDCGEASFGGMIT
jgi:hypothetical protein